MRHNDSVGQYQINQRVKSKDDVVSICEVELTNQEEVVVMIGTQGADGTVHIDAIRLLEVE